MARACWTCWFGKISRSSRIVAFKLYLHYCPTLVYIPAVAAVATANDDEWAQRGAITDAHEALVDGMFRSTGVHGSFPSRSLGELTFNLLYHNGSSTGSKTLCGLARKDRPRVQTRALGSCGRTELARQTLRKWPQHETVQLENRTCTLMYSDEVLGRLSRQRTTGRSDARSCTTA